MNIIGRYLARAEDILHYGGCAALVAVAVLLNIDVVMRLIAGVPLQIQFEVTELYLMPALATLSLARVFRDGGHLALEIVPEDAFGRFSGGVRLLRLAIILLFFVAVTWMSGHFALRAFQRGDIEFGVYDWPLGWAYLSVPLGCGMLLLRIIYEMAESLLPLPQSNEYLHLGRRQE